ncbi:MAG: 5-(carboxyamino)imidazole ribonucleotide synthase, partial [Armatimonadota bacterium]
ALQISQDRLTEKTFFQSIGASVPAFAAVDSWATLLDAVSRIGLPSVLKTRRLGYDGKGQYVLQTTMDVEDAWQALGSNPTILERFIDFERELSIIAVRTYDKTIAVYPLVQNHHREGILRLSIAPAPGVSADIQAQAEAIAKSTLEALDYTGVLAIELFQAGGRLIVNEMAPRVHNSGHWTIEGAVCSQFENHIRAISGLPLGDTSARNYCAMVNIIGCEVNRAQILSLPDVHLHLYGKAPRPDRKIGHITVMANTPEELTERLEQLRSLWEPGLF